MLQRKTKLDQAFDWIDLAFKVLFLVYGLLYFNAFTFGTSIMSAFVAISTLMAGILLLYRLFRWRHFVHNVVLWILIAFLVSYGISMVINYQYGIMDPLKTMVWMGMQYLLLFASDDRKNVDSHRKVFHVLAWVYVAYMFLASLASLIMMFSQYGHVENISGADGNAMRVITGFVWGRLWGVFTDPNYASTMSTVAVVFSLYFFKIHRNIVLRIFMVVNIILQTLYITFSDSRTGLVAIFLAIGVYFFCWMATKKDKIKIRSTAVRAIACVAAAAVVAGSCLVVISGVKTGYNAIIMSHWQQVEPSDEPDAEEPLEEPEKELVGREQDLENDFSNRRFDLWKASLDIIGDRPIFGVSYLNLMQYTEDHFPDNYLVHNDHGKFGNYHNVLINIAAGQGLLGLALFIAAGAIAGIKCIKRVAKNIDQPHSIFYIAAFSAVIAILSSSMFVSDLVYVNSANATMFWFLTGVLVANDRSEVKDRA